MFIVWSVCIASCASHSQVVMSSKSTMLSAVNKIRLKGCTCGNSKMPPANPVIWSDQLEKSSLMHAQDMQKHGHFSHFSHKGEDVGTRVEALGYNWQHIGENIASGRMNFDEVLNDWIKSTSHCKMLMNADMKEMGVARKGIYWVQHFGTTRPQTK